MGSTIMVRRLTQGVLRVLRLCSGLLRLCSGMLTLGSGMLRLAQALLRHAHPRLMLKQQLLTSAD